MKHTAGGSSTLEVPGESCENLVVFDRSRGGPRLGARLEKKNITKQ